MCWGTVLGCGPSGPGFKSNFLNMSCGPYAMYSSVESNFSTKVCFIPFSGAVLLRGFSIDSGVDFQSAVQQYCPELCDEYRGTSPRKLVPGTEVTVRWPLGSIHF